MSRLLLILLAIGLSGCAAKTYKTDEGFSEFKSGSVNAAAHLAKGRILIPLHSNLDKADEIRRVLKDEFQIETVNSDDWSSDYFYGFHTVMIRAAKEKHGSEFWSNVLDEAGVEMIVGSVGLLSKLPPEGRLVVDVSRVA